MLNKRFVLISLLVLLCLIIMIYQNSERPIKVLSNLEYPVVVVRKKIISFIGKVKGYLRKKKEIIEENKKLNMIIGQLQYKLEEYEQLKNENQRLRQLIGFSQHERKIVTFAYVITSLPNRWSGVIIIDKGKLDGIKKDMPVRTIKGLVGKIIHVEKSYSKVLLITDVNFSVAVKIKNTSINGVVSGTGDRMCILKYVLTDEKIQKGQLLVTSGIDGIFPEGIPVGYINKIYNTDEIFYKIIVKPIINIYNLKEVIVINKK